MKRNFVPILIAVFVGIINAASASAPSRLAILATDQNTETAALADLLTTTMAKDREVEIVERTEIARVLAEQKLSAAALARGEQRVQIGKLLRADGLVFLEQDSRKTRLSVKLVETRQGYQAFSIVLVLEKRKLADLLPEIAKLTRTVLPKLRMDPKDRVLISVIRIGNATLSPDHFWIEDDLPQLVGAYFSQQPPILVLERRDLGKVLNESELAAVDADFRTSAVFIDGEVYRRTGQEANAKDPAVSFVLRLRDARLSTLATVTEQGTLSELDRLISVTVRSAWGKLREIKPTMAGQPAEESRFWLDLARQQGLLWAAESAHALDTKDPEALIEVGIQLTREARAPAVPPSPEVVVRAAPLLERAAQVAQDTGSAKLRQAILENGRFILASAHSWMNPDSCERLKLARKLARLEAEQHLASGHRTLHWFMTIYLGGLFDNPFDRYSYVDGLLRRFSQSDQHPRAQRVTQSVVLVFDAPMPTHFFQDLLSHPDCEVRYSAHWRLHHMASSPADRQTHGLEALKLLDCAFADPGVIAGVFGESGGSSSKHLFLPSLAGLMESFPGQRAEAASLMYRRLRAWLDAGDVNSVLFCRPHDLVQFMTEEQRMDLIEKCLDLATRVNVSNAYSVRSYLDAMREIRRHHLEDHPEAKSGSQEVLFTTLLSTRSPAWQRMGKDMYEPWSGRDGSGPTPQRLLLDGSTLWVAFGYVSMSSHEDQGIALMGLDLKSGTITSLRHGTIRGKSSVGMSFHYIEAEKKSVSYELSPLCRWGDTICVGKRGAGVFLFPADASHDDHSLRQVAVIDEKCGLPTLNITAVAGLGDNLYIGLNESLVKWGRRSGKIELVANLKSNMGHSPLGTGLVDGLISDESRQALYAVVRADHNCHIWKYRAKNEQWERIISPMVPPEHLGPRVLLVDGARVIMPGDGHIYLVRVTESPGAMPIPVASFEVSTERVFTMAGEKPVPYMLPPGFMRYFDLVNHANGTLALDGYGVNWRLVFAKRGADSLPPLLTWAEPRTASATAAARGSATTTDQTQPPDAGSARNFPLHQAASTGDVKGVTELLRHDTKVNEKDDVCCDALTYAVKNGHQDVVQFLLQHGADVNAAQNTHDRARPLFWAVARGDLKLVKLLLDRGADVNGRTEGGRTPLIEASLYPRPNVLSLLLQCGADPNLSNKQGYAPSHYAIFSGQAENLRILLRAGAKLHSTDGPNDGKELFSAIQSGNPEVVGLVLDQGVSMDVRGEWNWRPLEYAASRSTLEVVELLIQRGAGVNIRGEYDMTPLHQAAAGKRADNIRVLLKHGADPTLLSHGGRNTALQMAPTDSEAHAVLEEAMAQWMKRSKTP